MTKSKSILNIIKISLVVLVLSLAGILVGCGSKEATQIMIALEDSSKTGYLPGETVDFSITADGDFNINEVELVVTNGGEYVTIMGHSVKVNENAIPGTTITVQAEYKDLVSNLLPFSVAHIEAEKIEISSEKNKFYASEIFDLNVSFQPTNATRNVEIKIVEGGDKATIVDNKISISSNAKEGDKVKVVASMGDVYSNPFNIEVSEKPEFISVTISPENIEIDSSTDKLIQPIYVKGYFMENDELQEIYTNSFTLTAKNIGDYEDANYDVVQIVDGLFVKAMNKGRAQVSTTFKDMEIVSNVTVLMTPDQIKLPDNFNRTASFNYQVSNEIKFNPNIIESHGSEDLKMFVKQPSGNTIVFQSNKGVWKTDDTTGNVGYDGNNLTINQLGEHEIYFQSLSGCAVEIKSPSVKININNAVNVSNKEEFENAFANEKEFNIVNDIIFNVGDENYTTRGDKTINGNGFNLDLSGQPTEKEGGTQRGKRFLSFRNENQTDPFKVEIRDLNIIGNFGLLSTEEFAEYNGVTTDVVEDKVSSDPSFITEAFYKKIIYICADDVNTSLQGPYAYAIPVIENISIKKCNGGVEIKNGVDEIELGKENARPAINGLSYSNMFGDGILYAASQINIKDLNIGTLGGSAITSGGSGSVTSAGVNRNDKSFGRFYGNISCDNVTDGTSLYTIGQLNFSNEISTIINSIGGLSGAIQMVVTQKTTELLKPYVDTDREEEIYQILQGAKSNILRQGSVNSFNLLCFTKNGTEDILFGGENSSLIVDFSDEYLYTGVDTQHKFIRVNVYDVLMSIKTLGQNIKDLLEQYGEALKPISVYVGNFNYKGN